MGVIASVHKISKTFGIQKLFEDITFSIEDNQRIGLIGPNGAGKSTLLQILAKRLDPDRGDVSFAKNISIGYLEQNPQFKPDEMVIDTILNGADDPTDPTSYSKAYEWLSKLDLEEETQGGMKITTELSGGWLKRVALARELIRDPQLFLLDEPTNHLDVESILWLEEALARQFQGSTIIITHDRLFLQNTCDMIFDLDRRNPDGLIKFEGTYADFLDVKNSLMDAQQNLFAVKKNTLRRETEWLRRGAKARQTKQVARINRALDLKDEVKDLGFLTRNRTVDFDFGKIEHNPKKVIELKDVSLTRGEKPLFSHWSYTLSGKARVGLIGRNGVGKTSLLKMLLGEISPTSGSMKTADNIKIAYFAQKKEELDPKISVLQTISPHGDYVHLRGEPVYAKSYLSRFHFRPDQMDLPVGKISGGEQSRLLIAQLMLRSESVLILDEPTNDLDIETLDSLQEALNLFEGAVILVTHDRYFMGQVCSEILGFSGGDGPLVSFADLFQWSEWQKDKDQKPDNAKKSSPGAAANDSKSSSQAKLTYKEQREFDLMEETIAKAEEDLKSLEQSMSQIPQSDYGKLNEASQNYQKQKDNIDKLYARWTELTEKIKNL